MDYNESILKKQIKIKNKPFYKIIAYLGETLETEQYILADHLNFSHKTIERHLKALCYQRIVYLHRTEHTARNSYYKKNIWRLTFKGLIYLICWQAHLSMINLVILDSIAKTHRNEWILFEEWDYIKTDLELKVSISSHLYNFYKNHVFANPELFYKVYRNSSKEMENLIQEDYGVGYEVFKEVFQFSESEEPEIGLYNMLNEEQNRFLIEANRAALLVDRLFKYGAGMDYRHKQFMMFLCQNSKLRSVILNEIDKISILASEVNKAREELSNQKIILE